MTIAIDLSFSQLIQKAIKILCFKYHAIRMNTSEVISKSLGGNLLLLRCLYKSMDVLILSAFAWRWDKPCHTSGRDDWVIKSIVSNPVKIVHGNTYSLSVLILLV